MTFLCGAASAPIFPSTGVRSEATNPPPKAHLNQGIKEASAWTYAFPPNGNALVRARYRCKRTILGTMC